MGKKKKFTPATLANAKMEKLMVKLATWLDDPHVAQVAPTTPVAPLRPMVGNKIKAYFVCKQSIVFRDGRRNVHYH